MSKKQNCWEFNGCGREPGGKHAAEHGECPAAITITANGINNGKNAGRICWAVAGTFSDKKISGDHAQKIVSCVLCEFYKKVEQEEGANFCFLKILPQTTQPK